MINDKDGDKNIAEKNKSQGFNVDKKKKKIKLSRI